MCMKHDQQNRNLALQMMQFGWVEKFSQMQLDCCILRKKHTKENQSTLNITDCLDIDPINHVMA